MKACGRMRWRIGRVRGKREILCQSKMSDMRLSFLTWHVLERPWPSTDSKGRDGKKDSKMACGKSQAALPSFLEPRRSTEHFLSQRNPLCGFCLWQTLNNEWVRGRRRSRGVKECRMVKVYAMVGWKTEEKIKSSSSQWLNRKRVKRLKGNSTRLSLLVCRVLFYSHSCSVFHIHLGRHLFSYSRISTCFYVHFISFHCNISTLRCCLHRWRLLTCIFS